MDEAPESCMPGRRASITLQVREEDTAAARGSTPKADDGAPAPRKASDASRPVRSDGG